MPPVELPPSADLTGRALTPNEAAKLLRKSPDWVRARIVAGELAALNLANSKLARPQYRILPQHLAAFIEKRRAATETKPVPKSKRQPAGMIDFFP